jgi:hypothetical protein
MHESDTEYEQLDRLLRSHPSFSAPPHFSERVMQRLADHSQLLPIWQYPVVQWFATATGLMFALSRLLAYIFSAWLSIQLAG